MLPSLENMFSCGAPFTPSNRHANKILRVICKIIIIIYNNIISICEIIITLIL
jgi:hypothetical protein